MKLEAIKAEMERLTKLVGETSGIEYPHYVAYRQAVKDYERLIDQLDPSEPLRRVREKVEWINHSLNAYGVKDEVLRIIDAELKEKKEMKKQTVEIEVPEGMEFIEEREPKVPSYMLRSTGVDCSTNITTKTVLREFVFRTITPPLELETDRYLMGSENIGYIIDSFYIRPYVKNQLDKIQIGNEPVVDSPAEARDLAKILNFWAETGKLPERVVVKGAK